MIAYRLARNFSLLMKVPKTVKPSQQPKSWFHKIFSKNQQSDTYILLKQLFEYLQSTDLFRRQFPYLRNTQRLMQNCMILHCYILRQRLKQQQSMPRSYLQKFTYNLQTQFYPDFAAIINTAIPTNNFRQHYAQAYQNKLQLYSQIINDHQWQINPNKSLQVPFEPYAPLFRKILYDNRVDANYVQLLKFCKYYLAHRKYLAMLDWEDMTKYKVKWGLEQLKYIGQVDAIKVNINQRNNNSQNKNK